MRRLCPADGVMAVLVSLNTANGVQSKTYKD